VKLKINGEERELPGCTPDTPLLWALRDEAGLTGTKFGCGMSLCGACTVHVDGTATRSCVLPCGQLGDRDVTTIEGLPGGDDHPLRRAWLELDVAQCGYCQVGQLMSAASLLEKVEDPSDDDIDAAMAGNICRCGTYPRIRAAIKSAAAILRGDR
jgi:isoquinoline 1-oxidoreductase alpha subunit